MPLVVDQCSVDNEALIVAIDSGSGSIKLGVAHVDRDSHEVHDLVSGKLSYQFQKDLNDLSLIREIELSGGKIQNLFDSKTNEPLQMCGQFTPFGSDSYVDLKDIYGFKLSEKIKENYIKDVLKVVGDASAKFPNSPVEVWLVGTAALRAAEDGQYFINTLKERINDELGIDSVNLQIISQEQEGEYGFINASVSSKIDQDHLISWDIGGGSMQISGKADDGHIEVLGGVVASSTFKTAVENYLEGNGKTLSNHEILPLSADNMKDLVDLAVQKVTFPKDQLQWFTEKQEDDQLQVVGIGGNHENLLGFLKMDGINIVDKSATVFTKADVSKLIDFLADKTTDDLKKIVPAGSHAFIGNMVSNSILILGCMEKFHIDSVRFENVSNVQSLLYKAANK